MKNKRHILFPVTAGLILLSSNLYAAAITWDAGGANNNWSTIDNWSDNLAATGDDVTFNATGALASGTTNTVDASISIASLTYSQESSTLQHTAAIAAGQTLTVAGNFLLAGSPTATTATNVTLTGSTGTLTVNGTSFQVGQLLPTSGTTATNLLDMSGLGTFNANLGTGGTFRLGASNTSTTGALTTVKLAATSSITANTLGIGNNAGRGGTHTLKLGSVANTVNANTVSVGSTSGRGNGNLSFETSTGTLLLRAADGTAAVTTMNMVNNGFGHNGTHTAVVDFSAHSVDAKIGALTMAKRTGTGSAGSNATLTFDTGTLEVASVDMAVATNALMTGANNATINIGGGTATFGAISMATNNGGGGTTAVLNFTGGNTTVTGDITRVGGTAAGTIIANLTLNGASTVLDMSGRNLTSLTSITYTNGVLKNLGTVNTGMTLAGSGSRVFDQAAGISGQIQGAITGTGLGLTKQGAGTLTLSGTNTYDGATQVDGGFLVFRNTGAKAADLVTAGAAGHIGLGVGAVSGDYTSADVAALFTNTLTGFSLDSASAVGIDTTAGSFNQATALTSARNLTKLGSNILTLSQANTYTGVTTLSAGAINLGVAENVGVSGPLGNSAAANPGSIVFSGGTLQYSASNTHDYSGRFSTAANQSYRADTNGQSVTWAADLISSGGTLSKLGTGSLTLTGNNTFTGNVTISTGELKITNSSALGTGPKTINAQNNAYLTLDGSSGNISLASNLSITTAGLSILNTAGDNVINGTVKTIAGNGSSTITSDGGSLNLAGNIDSGATGGRTLEFSGTSTGANIVNGSISNGTATLAITKSGTGTWALANTNSHTGNTNVNAGKLIINGNQTAATGLTSVAAGTTASSPVATLAGIGIIGGNVVLAAESASGFKNGGTLAPTAAASGTSLGVIGTTTFNAGSIFEWNLSATSPGTDPGVVSNSGSYGQLAGTGAITGSNAIFSIVLGAGNAFSDAFWNSDKSWTNVFSGSGATTNLESIFSGFSESGVSDVGLVSGRGTFSFTGTSTLTWTAVPEPTSALAGLLIGAGLLRRRRVC